ncbi:alpha/beta fold hydrolase [Heyndrickxia acidiproducens]|uniref:alpha/beta fold hydrolase n=1 Tax=Heyndrickxia acidiproducens TaxID=1121084 RepID=UPI00035CC00C|nr:alpha/beta fold hydrolase [Heyndrickxia acidiproducens]
MSWVQNRYTIFIGLLFSLAAILSITWFHQHGTGDNRSAASYKTERRAVPIVFVHGYKGTANSFGGMLDRFQQNHWGEKTMVIRVSGDGFILVNGKISDRYTNPMVQVIFSQNRASFSQTTKWLEKVMGILYTKYGVKEVNLVGHSMGGLVCTKYIEETYQEKNYPAVRKLITVGSPYKGVRLQKFKKNPNNTGAAAVDLIPGSKALQALVTHKNRFDPQIKVLAIAGVINEPATGDSLVSLDSALGGKAIVPARRYQSEVVYGKHAGHSALHENKKVDRMIGKFLWNLQ